MLGTTFAHKNELGEPFLQGANKRSTLWTNGTNYSYTLIPITLVDEMAATDIPHMALPCIILAMMKNGEIVEVMSAARCLVT